MKKLFTYLLILVASSLLACTKPYDDAAIRSDIEDLKERVTKLEELCNQMNTNISALQGIVDALQQNDYITNVAPITKNGVEIGYTISLASGKTITIYHGKNGTNGKDGQDGVDGKDGYTPIIGVKQFTDGIYYWTLDGDWLLDENGNKIKAQGSDGKDGQDGVDGEDGKDGANGNDGENGNNGQDGKDGITPILKIENDYWYVSYDNGLSWQLLSKATGEDGQDGANGNNGQDGDAFFQCVTQDEQFVYFTLADGTVITLPKGASLDIAFAESDLVVMSPNSARTIRYTVQSVTERVTVEVTSSSDIRAKVVADDATGKSGLIEVKSGAIIDEYSKVIVFVSNGEKVVMRSISFEQVGLEIADGASQSISAEGGNVSLNFLTNTEWELLIPAEAQSWIHIAPQTRMTAHSETLVVSENTTQTIRSASIFINSLDGNLSIEYNINQEVYDWITAASSKSWQDGDELSVFIGNYVNTKFKYTHNIDNTTGLFRGFRNTSESAYTEANIALYPYMSTHKLQQSGDIRTSTSRTQTYVPGGYERKNDIMVAVSSSVTDTDFVLYPLCAYLCIKLWGEDQVVKSIAITSKNGEALSGTCVVTPKPNYASTCSMTNFTDSAKSIKLDCGQTTIGSSETEATEFWIVVPPVALSMGYTITVKGLYDETQTIEQSAITFVSGTTYSITAQITGSSSGMGMGVGGWDNGENIGGEI